MDIQQGKSLYSEIQSRARLNVNGLLVKGSLREAAKEVWAKVSPDSNFDSWWNEVHKIGLMPAAIAPTDLEPTIDTDSKPSTSYRERYRDMARKYPFLPLDVVVNEMWGCGNGTLSSIRSVLKSEGFDFKTSAAGWEVIKRPAPPKPVAPTSPPKPTTPPLVQPELALSTSDNAAIVTRLDTIIVLLRSLAEAWNANCEK